MTLSKLAEECEKCSYKTDCDSKRMAACAYIENPSLSLSVESGHEAGQPFAQPILQAHDYRNVKVSENTTITIDIEGLKRRLVEDHYRKIGCYFGA